MYFQLNLKLNKASNSWLSPFLNSKNNVLSTIKVSIENKQIFEEFMKLISDKNFIENRVKISTKTLETQIGKQYIMELEVLSCDVDQAHLCDAYKNLKLDFLENKLKNKVITDVCKAPIFTPPHN